MSALYLGTGEREKRLVRAIKDNLTENHSELKVKILLDFCRGTRVVNGESSCTVLGKLLGDKKVTLMLFTLVLNPLCALCTFSTPAACHCTTHRCCAVY